MIQEHITGDKVKIHVYHFGLSKEILSSFTLMFSCKNLLYLLFFLLRM